MKIGDLVQWSEMEIIYHRACVNGLPVPDLAKVRKRGIIVDTNPRYYFVRWEDGSLLAQGDADIKVISEKR